MTITQAPSTVETTPDELRRHTAAAAAIAEPFGETSTQARARMLEATAAAIDGEVDGLTAIADEETALGPARLRAEIARTTGQLRLFAAVIREGAYLEAVIDRADPTSTPPRPDIRRVLHPIGPVAVFSASNFPFAFSVAGGDTASALAAGCPVIVKAHSGHPRLSERVAEIVTSALIESGAPRGTFACVQGRWFYRIARRRTGAVRPGRQQTRSDSFLRRARQPQYGRADGKGD